MSTVPHGWILDGEFYHHGWSLQQINSAIAVKRLHKTPATEAVSYNVFDIVSTEPFYLRFASVVPMLRDHKSVRAVPTHVCDTLDQALSYFHHYKRTGYEGIMFRHGPDGYLSKRCNSLLKHKAWFDSEFRIIGLEEGTGKCTDTLGALVCVTPAGKRFRVGTGFDDATRKMYFLQPPIGALASVQYIGLSDEGIPLNTSFQGLRE
jgi:DNA ligase-1